MNWTPNHIHTGLNKNGTILYNFKHKAVPLCCTIVYRYVYFIFSYIIKMVSIFDLLHFLYFYWFRCEGRVHKNTPLQIQLCKAVLYMRRLWHASRSVVYSGCWFIRARAHDLFISVGSFRRLQTRLQNASKYEIITAWDDKLGWREAWHGNQ